nr:ROK family protein [Deinobacterium chartae]
MHEGWVRPAGRRGGGAGRPAELLELSDQAGTLVGIDLRAGSLELAWSDLRAHQATLTLRPLEGAPIEGVLAALEEVCERAPFGPVRWATVALPAPVGRDGLPQSPNRLPQFDAWRLREACGQRHVPLTFENDANLAALAERLRGQSVHTDYFALLLERESGVGMGIFLNGEPYRGRSGRAGEVGLMQWPLEVPGRSTVLEAMARSPRQEALAYLMSSLSIALDLDQVVVHAETEGLRERLETVLPPSIAVVDSALGQSGPVWGALLTSARRHAAQLLETPQAVSL